ncbi:hypothetical protein ACIPIN_24665 [Pseudomonas sp. NPDC087697]|uniref:hypothetical protein n=1 Tax=Pseudomonas sp. NPDC087697 TaxID=3364447 RepID=UPI0038019E4F
MTAQETVPKTRAAIPAPLEKSSIRQALNGSDLDPKDVYTTNPNRLTAEIKRWEQGLLESDTFFVTLTGWNGTEPRGSYTSPTLQFGPPILRTLNLDVSVVAFNLGKKIKVQYTVNRVGETSVPSEVLELDVLELSADALEKGRILEAQDGGNGPELDLTTNTEDRTLRIENWPLIAIGQWCWVVLKGKTTGGGDYDKTLFKGQVAQDWITLGYIERPVPYSELKELVNGSDLTLEYKVAFDQVDDVDKAHGSQVRSYTVKTEAVEVKPAITAVTDSKDVPIADNGTTTDTTVKLSGTVATGEKVDIYDGTTLLGEATTTGTAWTYEAKNLTPKAYAFKAKGKYGSLPESNIRNVTVQAVEVKPEITAVTDSKDVPIADNGTTTDTTVKLSGTVAEGETVDIYDAATLLGEAITTGTTWTYEAKNLTPKAYAFKAKGKYGSLPESNIRNVTVRAVSTDKPDINSVTELTGAPVPHGTTTFSASVKLRIKAGASEEVEFFVNGVSKGKYFADDQGDLTQELTGLGLEEQDLTVKGVASGLVSDIWTVIRKMAASDGTLTITASKGPQRKEIPRGGATTADTITLQGTAKRATNVTVLDVFTTLRTIESDRNGYWSISLSSLKAQYYHFALSAPGAEPPMLWPLAVFAVGTPIIESVSELEGNTIPPYGETSKRALTLRGTGAVDGEINIHELLSGRTFKASKIDAQGRWEEADIIVEEPREYHYVASAPGEGTPKSNLYRVRKIAPTK